MIVGKNAFQLSTNNSGNFVPQRVWKNQPIHYSDVYQIKHSPSNLHKFDVLQYQKHAF